MLTWGKFSSEAEKQKLSLCILVTQVFSMQFKAVQQASKKSFESTSRKPLCSPPDIRKHKNKFRLLWIPRLKLGNLFQCFLSNILTSRAYEVTCLNCGLCTRIKSFSCQKYATASIHFHAKTSLEGSNGL